VVLFTYVQFYRDKKGEWRWRVKSENNKVLGMSSESYKNLGDCKKGFKRIKWSISLAEIIEYRDDVSNR
jgi:uncharacterized protein YegP (UPF0339 family)